MAEFSLLSPFHICSGSKRKQRKKSPCLVPPVLQCYRAFEKPGRDCGDGLGSIRGEPAARFSTPHRRPKKTRKQHEGKRDWHEHELEPGHFKVDHIDILLNTSAQEQEEEDDEDEEEEEEETLSSTPFCLVKSQSKSLTLNVFSAQPRNFRLRALQPYISPPAIPFLRAKNTRLF